MRVLPTLADEKIPRHRKCPCGTRRDAFVRYAKTQLAGWRRSGR
jgi:hypothetical protein